MKHFWRWFRPWFLAALAVVAFSLFYGCPLRRMFGVGCPLCGISRALLAALRLDFQAAFRYHPLWPVLSLALLLGAALERRRPGSAKPLGWAVGVLAIAVYAVRMYCRDPIVFP